RLPVNKKESQLSGSRARGEMTCPDATSLLSSDLIPRPRETPATQEVPPACRGHSAIIKVRGMHIRLRCTNRGGARFLGPALWLALCATAIGVCWQLALTSTAAEKPTLPPDHAEKLAKGQELFTQQVRKVLMDQCVKCHGGAKTKADLDLTTREGLLRGGSS